MAIASREDLKDYALRRLGFPVIEINVDDSQVEDRIDDALQFFAEYHFDGVEEVYVPYVLTQTDIDNRYINTNNISPGSSGGEIISITKVFIVDEGTQSGMFSVQYQLMLNDYFNGFLTGTSNLSYYDTTKQYLSLLQQFLSPEKTVGFSRVTNKLKINTDWSEMMKVGDKIMVQAYVSLNPQTYPEIYNDLLLKKYVTSLIKRQWASNLSKFSNIALPGGMQFDARDMYNDSMVELTQIEETVQSKYQLPTDFMVG
jgi:hypothetical protein